MTALRLGTRGSALTRFIPMALATGRFDLRPDCYVQEITVDAQGQVQSAVYWDAQAQDRSTSLEAQRTSTVVVTDARR